MGLLFKDDLQDSFGTWALGYIPYGGADFGEVQAIARTVGDGDDGAFYTAWANAGDRLTERGKEALAKGRRASARDAFLRAACHYGSSYHLLFGAPVDPRLLAAFRKQIAAFNDALALLDPPAVPMRIPFGEQTLPAYVLPAAGRAYEARPLVILTNGYDATVTDMYFASAVAASRRGYHCLFFDGPGQGEMLIEHGTHIRPDWESVIAPVVDFALTLEHVDSKRIALIGWSLGGYLSPRAASGEHRLAACVADPGLFGIAEQVRHMLVKLGATLDDVADLGAIDDRLLERVARAADADPHLHWSLFQRGFWVHGVDTLRDYFRCVGEFTLSGRVESIACPTLLTAAENDPLAVGARAFYDALRCPKQLLAFTAAEGAGAHVEAFNRSLLNDRVFDWLESALGS
ncbi:MAG TPA: alpha/beta hydrolase [Candidatus Cybelea sp.]|jgi:pimeloyl-ACP methyl ester carboxylesterase|nr:alpha/beta hydrolase [Candidatus Cybelea sp.]